MSLPLDSTQADIPSWMDQLALFQKAWKEAPKGKPEHLTEKVALLRFILDRIVAQIRILSAMVSIEFRENRELDDALATLAKNFANDASRGLGAIRDVDGYLHSFDAQHGVSAQRLLQLSIDAIRELISMIDEAVIIVAKVHKMGTLHSQAAALSNQILYALDRLAAMNLENSSLLESTVLTDA